MSTLPGSSMSDGFSGLSRGLTQNWHFFTNEKKEKFFQKREKISKTRNFFQKREKN
jgi:hypothetical protein